MHPHRTPDICVFLYIVVSILNDPWIKNMFDTIRVEPSRSGFFMAEVGILPSYSLLIALLNDINILPSYSPLIALLN